MAMNTGPGKSMPRSLPPKTKQLDGSGRCRNGSMTGKWQEGGSSQEPSTKKQQPGKLLKKTTRHRKRRRTNQRMTAETVPNFGQTGRWNAATQPIMLA